MSQSTDPNEGWQLKISLRWEVDGHGKPLDTISEEQFGFPITLRDDVEICLRRAQFACLHPDIPRLKVLNASTDELQQMYAAHASEAEPFSRNVVCVDIRSPDLPNLSFIDLPGMFYHHLALYHPNVLQVLFKMRKRRM